MVRIFDSYKNYREDALAIWDYLRKNPQHTKEELPDHLRYLALSYYNNCACCDWYMRKINYDQPKGTLAACKGCPLANSFAGACVEEKSLYERWINIHFMPGGIEEGLAGEYTDQQLELVEESRDIANTIYEILLDWDPDKELEEKYERERASYED